MGALLLILCALHGALMFAPLPNFELWKARLIAREISLSIPVAALLALALLRGRAPRLLALGLAGVGLLPLLLALPLCAREGLRLSPWQYLTGAPRAEVRVEPDVVLEPSRPDLTADLYHGRGPGPHPAVVVIHGGSWQRGDKGEVETLSRHLALAGVSVLDVRYRLAPAHRFPAPIGDVKCLLGRLRERARAWDLAPQRVALLGRSAGGQIALVSAYSTGEAALAPACSVKDEAPQAVISVYAPTDLVYGYEHPLWPDIVRGTESLEIYLGGTPAQRPEAYRLGSATSWTQRRLPRTLLIYGDGDALVSSEHARRLAAALAQAGQPARALHIPLADHGFDFRSGGIGEQIERGAVLDFVRATLRSP